jgi:transposase
LHGKTIGIDATTLEANAAMRSIVRRDTGESYQEFLARLAKSSGIKTPTREALARLDRRRKKRTSNQEWKSPTDGDAKITRMKDGRTHLGHKAEHAVDMATGAIVAVTVQGADCGDTSSLQHTLAEAEKQIETIATSGEGEKVHEDGVSEVVADRGYHSDRVLNELDGQGLRCYIPEPKRPRRKWDGDTEAQQLVYGNRRRIRGARGRRLLRSRGELIERRDASDSPTRSHEHPQAAACSQRSVQSRVGAPEADRDGHAARVAGLRCPHSYPAVEPPDCTPGPL